MLDTVSCRNFKELTYFTLLCCSTAVTAVWTGPLLLVPCCQEPSQGVDTDCLHLQLVVSAAGRTPKSAGQPVARLHPLVFEDRQGMRGTLRSDAFQMIRHSLKDSWRVKDQVVIYDG